MNIWRQFNKFVINLDNKPKCWEDRIQLFIGYKIDQGMQSSTVKTYISAIKKTLIDDGYHRDDQKVILGSLTKACKLVNEKVFTRLPIQCGLLEMILFELQRIFRDSGQHYIQHLYKAMFALSYYGMMRISEIAKSDHVLKARNVHAAANKEKLKIILYTLKTHGIGMRPQKIEITSNRSEKSGSYTKRYFCPLAITNYFMTLRGGYEADDEQYFVFHDGTPVTPNHTRQVLKTVLTNLGLQPQNYGMHSFRIGRTTDLIKYNYTIEEVRRMGRWHSNTVYKYIR